MFILNTSDTKCINYLFIGTFTVQKTSNEHYKNLFIENEHHIHHIVLMTNSTLYIICNSFTCKQLWAKPMVNWYSITLGGHTEGWKISYPHTNNPYVITKQRCCNGFNNSLQDQRWQKLWVTCESCKFYPKVWNMSHLQLFTKSTLIFLQDTFTVYN